MKTCIFMFMSRSVILRMRKVSDTSCLQNQNSQTYLLGSKSFRPDIQNPRQMENAVRDI